MKTLFRNYAVAAVFFFVLVSVGYAYLITKPGAVKAASTWYGQVIYKSDLCQVHRITAGGTGAVIYLAERKEGANFNAHCAIAVK